MDCAQESRQIRIERLDERTQGPMVMTPDLVLYFTREVISYRQFDLHVCDIFYGNRAKTCLVNHTKSFYVNKYKHDDSECLR